MIYYTTLKKTISEAVILLLIDFDSISWIFTEYVLDFFKFRNSIKHWFKLFFFTNSKSAVTQNIFFTIFLKFREVADKDLRYLLTSFCYVILRILIRKSKILKALLKSPILLYHNMLLTPRLFQMVHQNP